jgi:two-component system sensor histidine kinase MtrB
MSRIARRVAWIAFGVLALQFVGALLVQVALSKMVRGEVIHQMTRGMESSQALVDCVARPGPWEHLDGLWTVWPLSPDGTPVGDMAPVDHVALPAPGASAPWSTSAQQGIVYASLSRGCGGVLIVQHSRYPFFEARSLTFASLAAARVALVLITGVALVALTALPLARRVRRLSEAMRRVVAADFAGTVADGADDELGEVASAFDAATATARERMQQLTFRDTVVRHALADFAHDARTPQATLKLAASSLPPSTSTTLIRSELDFLEGMTRNLEALLEDSDATRALTPVAVDQLVERVKHRFAPLARDRNLTIETALPDAPLYVLAESIALERAISNLLQNSVRFASTHIALLVFEDGAEVRLEVCDDGPGFGELTHRASERGTRGAEASEGSGLGLAIAEASARRFGGRLETGSAEGGGALVALVLPIAPPGDAGEGSRGLP